MDIAKFLKRSGIVLMSLGLFACAHAGDNATESTSQLTDANIAAIVVGANKIDISAGQIALNRATNPQVKEFAQRMVTDHQSVLDAAVKLATRLNVTPVNNDLVHTLAKQASDHEANLKTLSGGAFDKAYIDHEVAYHEAVIGIVKSQLIPGAQNQELKDMLVSVLPAFDAHLAHSKKVQSQVSSGS